ncbi:MAG: DUF1016 N-terminal domain-containing protein [Desulfuromonadaceae bacterium]|nr:DUF1016 N-terminal domain-containing protein [Desulfuromonadaceae bacterium]
MITTYCDVGKIINDRQKFEGWGTAVIPRLSRDITNELPEVKGFSERNIKRMLAFYREYFSTSAFVPQPVAQMDASAILQQFVAKIPWGHNILLMEKVKDLTARLWYMPCYPHEPG